MFIINLQSSIWILSQLDGFLSNFITRFLTSCSPSQSVNNPKKKGIVSLFSCEINELLRKTLTLEEFIDSLEVYTHQIRKGKFIRLSVTQDLCVCGNVCVEHIYTRVRFLICAMKLLILLHWHSSRDAFSLYGM